jgi:NAD(P)-dependent dehydrogenase (short-subunit alcohol dehydrogenase family)
LRSLGLGLRLQGEPEGEQEVGLLDGKVAIITGGGNGLGAAYCELLASEGAAVVVNDLGVSREGESEGVNVAEIVAERIRARGGRAVANCDDVSTVEGGRNILQSALTHFGRIDILVNNAGILRDRTFANISEKDWDDVVKVHLKGAYCVTHPVWQEMKSSGSGGVIIFTTSPSGLHGNFGQTNYGAAKAALYGMTRVLSLEGRKYGIRVWGIAPGAHTRMTADLTQNHLGEAIAQEPDPMSLPERIAPAILYMASELSGHQTGKTLLVWGRTIRELRIMDAPGFLPEQPWTAQDLADHEAQIFFPEER